MYHRTTTTGWAAAVPLGWSCTDISAALAAAVIEVGCRGTNGSLYAFSLEAVDYPYTESLVGLGGSFAGVPAVVATSAPLVAGLPVGVTYLTSTSGGQTMARTRTADWVPASSLLDGCSGMPAAEQRADGVLFAACQRGDGIQVAWSAPTGASGGYVKPGVSAGRLGLTVDDGATALNVQGANGSTYVSLIEPGWQTPTDGWVQMPGVTVGGLSAS